MGKHRSVAVEKAKRQGAKKYFYITGPAGWGLAEVLPRIDMVSRLFVDLFAEQKIPQDYYEQQRGVLYSYIEGIDEWVSVNAETLLRAGLLGDSGADYINLYKHGIKKKKTMYLNSQIALNAYYSFIKCDALSALMTMGLRKDIMPLSDYKRAANAIFSMIDSLKADIENMREFICECRK